MKTQGKVWIIFDTETKAQTQPMSVVQAQVTLLSLAHNPARYFLWTPGWNEWVCVSDFLDSDQKYFVVMQPPKPPVPNQNSSGLRENITITQNAPPTLNPDSIYTQVVDGEIPIKEDKKFTGYYDQDFNGDELDLKKIKKIKAEPLTKTEKKPPETSGSDRRRDVRHNFKIEVVLVSKIRSFRSYSRNISLSGTMLENEIPKDFLNKPFDLIIVNPFEPDTTKARLLFRAKIVGDMKDPRRLMFIEQDVAMTVRLDALLKAYVAYQSNIRKGTG